MTHEWKLRVYFEDTDAGGVVYHANYLKFMERARTEMMRGIGVSHAAMIASTKTVFMLHACSLTFHKPARLEEEIVIRTKLKDIGGASLTLHQTIYRDDALLVSAEIGLACVNESGMPCRIQAAIKSTIETALAASS